MKDSKDYSMAKGKKTGGRDFEAGNSGGPGRPPLPDDLRNMRRLNKVELERILNRLIFLKEAGLKAILKDEEVSSLEKVVASGVIKAIEEGDFTRMTILLDRLVGKVPQPVHTNIPPEFIDAYEKMKDWNEDQLREAIDKLPPSNG